MNIYVDASFLVSTYSVDGNFEAAIQTLENSSGTRLVTPLGELEVVNALELRFFRKEMSRAQVESCLDHFKEDMKAGVFRLRALPQFAFERARDLSRQTTARLGTRSSDILHVAAALELGADSFFSFDKTQRKLAQAMKLTVNHYV